MPELARPDGARIHYEVRGEGPPVMMALGFAATPDVYEGLAEDLLRDHAVVTWDPRGCGRSSQAGPYDIGTDGEDMLAVIEDVGESVKVFAIGHGVNVSIAAAACDPGAVRSLVTPAVVVALRNHLGETEGFGGSRPVLDMLIQQLRSDPRGAARATLASLNPQYSEEELRARVDDTLAYIAPDTMLARIQSWLEETTALDRLRALGDRLGVLWHEGDSWQSGSVPRARELLPDARFIHVHDGPLSRPDLAAQAVREMP